MNRWDSPLFLVINGELSQADDIYNALYKTKPLKSNQSTQCQPLSSTNFLYELDKVSKDVVSGIMAAQKMGEAYHAAGESFSCSGHVTLGKLSHLRRQFIVYTKLHPVDDVKEITP